jgi:putative NADPH-quinone reductase
MQISLILAHPDPASFNHAIAQTALDALVAHGHTVRYHDLYAEGFDPILPAQEIPRGVSLPGSIQTHCDELASADGIIIVHPNWWGQPPAILKGWIDRVIRPDVAYRFLEGDAGDGVPLGLLKARAALVLNTSNTAPDREKTVFGDPLQLLWKNCIFDLCGVADFQREMFTVVVTSTPQQRRAWLARVRNLVQECFPSG